jgi:hypothetical protein
MAQETEEPPVTNDGQADSPDTTGFDRFIASLTINLPHAGDHSFEAITALGNAVPLRLHNDGPGPLVVWLEPKAAEYRLAPGSFIMITSHGHWTGQPFQIHHEPGLITVWATSWFATVTDGYGNEVPAEPDHRPA